MAANPDRQRISGEGKRKAESRPSVLASLLSILCILSVVVCLFAGCRNDKQKKALEETAQARAEVVKLKAEILRLEGQRSNLLYKLQAAELERENIREQLEEMLDEQDVILDEAQQSQQEFENLKARLSEQTKKSAALEKQIEQLKAVIRELQSSTTLPTAGEDPRDEVKF